MSDTSGNKRSSFSRQDTCGYTLRFSVFLSRYFWPPFDHAWAPFAAPTRRQYASVVIRKPIILYVYSLLTDFARFYCYHIEIFFKNFESRKITIQEKVILLRFLPKQTNFWPSWGFLDFPDGHVPGF